MQNILFDTNIIIYFLKRDSRVITFLDSLEKINVHISIISWIEILTGSFRHGKKISEMAWSLSHFIRLPINDAVGQTAAFIMQEKLMMGKKKDFQDSLIAATAVMYNMTLVTNNPRDFRGIKGLKIISPKK